MLNVAWSVLFFGLRLPGIALLEIILLWIAILITVLVFRSHSVVAAWHMLPYLAWVVSGINGADDCAAYLFGQAAEQGSPKASVE